MGRRPRRPKVGVFCNQASGESRWRTTWSSVRKLKYVVEVHSATTNRHSEYLPPHVDFRAPSSESKLLCAGLKLRPKTAILIDGNITLSLMGLPSTSHLLKIHSVGSVLIARSSNLKRDVDSLVRGLFSHLS